MGAPRPTSPAELLRRLIRFDTTNPPGDEGPCLEYLRGLFAASGDGRVDCQVLESPGGRPNLVVRVAGRGEAPPLLMQGHVDVVTTAGQHWTHPPFGGDLVKGWVWGRGALDMKGGPATWSCAAWPTRRRAGRTAPSSWWSGTPSCSRGSGTGSARAAPPRST